LRCKVDAGNWTKLEDSEWDSLVEAHGSPFQNSALLHAVTASWPGVGRACHVRLYEGGTLKAGLPLYVLDACPRLDYYRRALPIPFEDPLLVSHALVGWEGFPVAVDLKTLDHLLTAVDGVVEDDDSTVFLTGIPERKKELLDVLQARGYHVNRFHTTMLQTVGPMHAEEQMGYLHGRHRKRIRHALSKCRRAGIRHEICQNVDVKRILGVFARQMASLGVAPDVLDIEFVEQLLISKHPSMEFHVATSDTGSIVGFAICLHWAETYYLWLAAYEPSIKEDVPIGHAMYINVLHSAVRLGAKFIDVGRSPYDIKRRHGFRPAKLMAAVKAPSSIKQQRAASWLDGLAIRHLSCYPELG
jgi:predicted N-acyltransferase